MKFMLSLLALGHVALATPSLPVHPGGIGGLFKGPNSETIIKGPDGSIITAAVEGGEVHSNLEPIVAAEPAVIPVNAAPAVASVAAVATPIEPVAIPAPVVEPEQSSDLIGPSGRIVTDGSKSVVAGPASTTVTGPAVVSEAIIKGPPIIASPVLNSAVPIVAPVATVTPSPIATIGGAFIGPVSVTAVPPLAVPIATVTASPIATITGSPISVTGAPVATVTSGVAPLSVTPLSLNAEVAPISVTDSSVNVLAGAVPTVPVAQGIDVTGLGLANGQVSTVTATAPHGVATASISPHASAALATSVAHRISVNAAAFPNVASASVNNEAGVSSVTASPLPIVTSTVSPVNINGLQSVHPHDTAIINDRIDLPTPQLIPDQISVDNRHLGINPALIPSANILPPEIGITPRVPVSGVRLSPRPVDVLTTPGLGSVATGTNIQRVETDGVVNVTPHGVQIKNGLIKNQLVGLQNQQALINSQIQHVQPTADPRVIHSNQQIVEIIPRNEGLLTPTTDSRLTPGGEPLTTLTNIEQQKILSSELARAGIDASQLQLTNVPLSAVSVLPTHIGGTGNSRNGIVPTNSWGRYGRGAEDSKNSKNKEN